MKKILLPTDFSDNSFNAIMYALQAFKQETCTFYLLNTYAPIIYDTEYVGYSSIYTGLSEVYKKQSQEGLTRLQERIDKHFANPNHRFQHLLTYNVLTEEIRYQVETQNIELIVMGTQGATGAKEVLFGSNTVHVINRSNAPVLAIPTDFEYDPIKEILFPTDFEVNFTVKQMSWMLFLANQYKAKLHVLHAKADKELSSEQEQAKTALEKLLSEINTDFHWKKEKSIPKSVYDFQQDHEIDLLVMLNNKHSFFENLFFRPVVNQIGFHTKIPFLVLPGKKA